MLLLLLRLREVRRLLLLLLRARLRVERDADVRGSSGVRDYVHLLEVLQEGVQVGEVQATAGVVAAQLRVTVEDVERIHERLPVALY